MKRIGAAIKNESSFKSGYVDRLSKKYINWFVIALVTPYSLAVSLGPLVLTPMRVFAIFVSFKMFSWLNAKRSHLDDVKMLDAIAIFHCVWVILAIFYHHGFGRAMESGGIYALEFLPVYAFGRYVAMRPERLSYFTKLMFFAAMVMAPIAYLESFTGFNLPNKLLNMIGFHAQPAPSEPRFGLNRASATMPHPILYGLFASSVLGLSCFVLSGSKLKRGLWTFWATFPALSSAPLLSVMLQGGLIAWDYFLRNKPRRWYFLLGIIFMAYLGIEMLSNRDAVTVLMNYLTFNAQTGYWRKLIWEYGSMEVSNSPFFGIGFNDWHRPEFMWSSSVDSFWLLTAMRYGLPGVGSLLLITALTMRNMLTKSYGHLSDYRMGWFVSMLGIMMVGITVHFWASTFVLYALILGVGVSVSAYKVNSRDLMIDDKAGEKAGV